MGPSAACTAAGLVRIKNINGAAAIEGTNQNEDEGADFSAVVDSSLEIFGTGNQGMAPWMLRSGKTFHLPSLYSIFLNKALHTMKRRVEIVKRVEEGYKFDAPPQR